MNRCHLLIALLLSLCSIRAAADWPLNVITAMTQEDPMYQGLLHFQKNVARRTQGQVTVRIFYGSQLGNDKDILEQAKAGANVAVLVDAGRLSVYTEELGILAAPYLVDGLEEARQLVSSPLFASWAQDLRESADLQILSFNWWQGDRHMLTNRPVQKPEDLHGLRIRTIGAPAFIKTVAAMGGTPTPIAWAELYPALQQKVVDGAEAQHPATYGSRLYEVIGRITKTAHINLMTGLVAGSRWFDKLPPHLQQIVLEEAFAAGDHASSITAKLLDEYEQKMRAEGVIIEEVDKAPFICATESVYKALGYQQLREQVNRQLSDSLSVPSE